MNPSPRTLDVSLTAAVLVAADTEALQLETIGGKGLTNTRQLLGRHPGCEVVEGDHAVGLAATEVGLERITGAPSGRPPPARPRASSSRERRPADG